MRKIFIKHNPYRLETTITIDGKAPKTLSELHVGEKRLQEWIDELPELLLKECAEKEFKIIFHGIDPDYEDVVDMAEEAKTKGITINVEHIPAKEVNDKETAIREIFKEIQEGPFEELKKPDMVRAFELADSRDFEVSVVATMSAGKSTLINSLLGQKLMPAKQDACTAIITEIKDNDADHFCARAYDKDGKLIEFHENLTNSLMKSFNENQSISKVKAEGNIPFVTADDVSLVLVDTPGPNNSRDLNHKTATYEMLSNSSKALVLYIMNATQLGTNDDKTLLTHVADSMKVGGKKSRDRFIFVVNKLDDFKKDEDSIEGALQKVKGYLADIGIENPNIYPASALTALNIRTILAESDDLNNDDVDDAMHVVRKFNKNKEKYLEQYAPLPASVKSQIEDRLETAISNGDVKEQALIHSGVVSIEEAIRTYVRKYAKAAKIKNIADTFIKNIESAHTFETAIQRISQDEFHRQEIIERIDTIEAKLKSGVEAMRYKEEIEKINYNNEIETLANAEIKNAQEKITKYLEKTERKLSEREAKEICGEFEKFARELQADVQVKLEEHISQNIQKNATKLLDTYKKKLSDLVNEVSIAGIEINPYKMMLGEIPSNSPEEIENRISLSRATEEVPTGKKKWVLNKEWRIYDPLTWLDGIAYRTDVTKKIEYIDAEKLAQKYFAPIEEDLYDNRDAAVEYAKEQAGLIKNDFIEKFAELDKVLQKKLDELEACATDEMAAEEKLEESRRKLDWLEDIQARVNAILDI